MRERLKEPREGSERDSETVRLQAMEPLCASSGTVYLLYHGSVSYVSAARLSRIDGAKAKASLKWAFSRR